MGMRAKSVAALLFVIPALLGPSAWGQAYPSRPVKVIVPFPPGATTDILARVLGEKLWAKWGQPFVLENRAGAGGNMGAEAVFKSEPDGHTLLCTPPSPLVINKELYAKLAFEPEAFVPVTVIAAVPTLLVANPKMSANTVRELISNAKADPGRLNYASQGNGTTAHLAGELFASMAGIKIVHVPYKGASPALTDLISGQVDMMFAVLSSSIQHVRAGQLKALAISSAKRNAFLPDIPTVSETLPGFVSTTWFGVVAPPKTPPEIANQLSAAMVEALKLPDVAKRLVDLNAEPIGNTPAEMAAFMREEVDRWGGVMRSAGLKKN